MRTDSDVRSRGLARASTLRPRPVIVRGDGVALEGDLVVPEGATSVVVFAHGSGSSRHSPRHRQVAEVFHDAALGTLRLDLLTPEEAQRDARTRELRFDVTLLGDRLVFAIDWLQSEGGVAALTPGAERRIGLFGASTGAAAALIAAAARPERVQAVVSRGGRPDLAGSTLARVRAPTLLLVGSRDLDVLELNRRAMGAMDQASCEIRIVPGASHLFEEPGTLDDVSRQATRWFTHHLVGAAGRGAE